MQINLTPELNRLVQAKVDSGLYEDASEVVREALRLLFEREPALDWLRQEARLGFEQLASGESIEVTREEFMKRIREPSL